MSDTKKIYIDIHSLLDIRQSALVQLLGEKQALEEVGKESYYLRNHDIFPVDMTLYNGLMESTEVGMLSHATVTYMMVVLTGRVAQMEKVNAFEGENSLMEVVVNTHPYQLSEKNALSLKNAIFIKIGMPVMITFVCENLSVWTPTRIKHSGVRYFYCYHGAQWLAENCEALPSGVLKDVRMFFPCLGREKVNEEEHKSVVKTGFRDVFGYTEYLLSGVVNLQFLPVVFYSNAIMATSVIEGFNKELKDKPFLQDSLEK